MPAPAGELALPLAPPRLGRRGQAVRGAEAPLRPLAHQERGAAAAHHPQGRHQPREVPARVPRQGPRAPAPARPPRRGRGHRHARVHDQPRDHQQVRADAAGPLRAQVLLPQRHRLEQRRGGVVGVGEEDDPGPGRGRGLRQAAVRPGRRRGACTRRGSPSRGARWPSTARSSASCPPTSAGWPPRSASAVTRPCSSSSARAASPISPTYRDAPAGAVSRSSSA